MENSVNDNNYFITSKYTDEERVMQSKSDNTEIMINDEAHEVTEELFESLCSMYQADLEEAMKVAIYMLRYSTRKKS